MVYKKGKRYLESVPWLQRESQTCSFMEIHQKKIALVIKVRMSRQDKEGENQEVSQAFCGGARVILTYKQAYVTNLISYLTLLLRLPWFTIS